MRLERLAPEPSSPSRPSALPQAQPESPFASNMFWTLKNYQMNKYLAVLENGDVVCKEVEIVHPGVPFRIIPTAGSGGGSSNAHLLQCYTNGLYLSILNTRGKRRASTGGGDTIKVISVVDSADATTWTVRASNGTYSFCSNGRGDLADKYLMVKGEAVLVGHTESSNSFFVLAPIDDPVVLVAPVLDAEALVVDQPEAPSAPRRSNFVASKGPNVNSGPKSTTASPAAPAASELVSPPPPSAVEASEAVGADFPSAKMYTSSVSLHAATSYDILESPSNDNDNDDDDSIDTPAGMPVFLSAGS